MTHKKMNQFLYTVQFSRRHWKQSREFWCAWFCLRCSTRQACCRKH